MQPIREIFAVLAFAGGGVAGWASGSNDTIGGIERTAVGAASIAIQNAPADALCLRVTVAGSRTDVRTLPLALGPANLEFRLEALPVGRDTVLAETFSVPCSALGAGATPNGHGEPTLAMVSAGDTARVTVAMVREARWRVAAGRRP